MPAGFGFHPYFLRALASRDESVELEAHCRGAYPGDTPLPCGPPVPISVDDDYTHLRRLGFGTDRCFAGWDGRALLHWPASRLRLRIEADAPLRHLVLYTPPGERWFALEPVSHATDGFNLLAQGQEGTGIFVLAPGESASGGMRMALGA
jgi:aldose 1-epimerase